MKVNGVHSSLKLSTEYGSKYIQFAKVVKYACNLAKCKMECGRNLERLRLSAKEAQRKTSTVSGCYLKIVGAVILMKLFNKI